MSKAANQGTLIKCAECIHCKMVKEVAPSSGRYVIKAKCARGHWLRGRQESTCDIHRVLARRTRKCQDYSSTSDDQADRDQYLRDLSSELPNERYIYEADGSYADLTEVRTW
jgi:hypothetical protein